MKKTFAARDPAKPKEKTVKKPRRKVLSAEELKILANLPTTVEEAQTIKRRFKAILDGLKKPPVNRLDIYEPCPHCAYDKATYTYCCGKCRYNKMPFTDRALNRVLPCMRCLNIAFGVITARDVTDIVVLSHHKATVLGTLSSSLRAKELVSMARIWAKGHVEWADAVIKAGGTHLEYFDNEQ